MLFSLLQAKNIKDLEEAHDEDNTVSQALKDEYINKTKKERYRYSVNIDHNDFLIPSDVVYRDYITYSSDDELDV